MYIVQNLQNLIRKFKELFKVCLRKFNQNNWCLNEREGVYTHPYLTYMQRLNIEKMKVTIFQTFCNVVLGLKPKHLPEKQKQLEVFPMLKQFSEC